jgi:hypothetical protein
MAEYTPPTDNVPIFDVLNFISSSGSGLTEAQIATKFLRYPTGQGTETLPELITGSITAPNTLDIVMPNSSSTNVMNVGVVNRNISGQVHHYSDGDDCVAGAGVHLNNGNNNASNTNIMNGSNTTGTLNLMTGGGTNFVNLGSASTTLTTLGDIRLNSTGTTNTSIGNTGATNLNGATVSINTLGGTDTIIGKNSSGTTSLNNPTVNLGRVASSTTTVRGLQVNISGTTNDIVGTTNINNVGTRDTRIGNAGASNYILGPTTINTSGGQPTSIGNGASTTNIVGPINLNGVGSTSTELITIGNSTGGITTLASDTINIGNADTLTTMNATNIKQVIKILDGSSIENTVGNTNVNSSMSTTFNKKSISPVGGAIPCYTITANTSTQFTCQYFEIVVSGSNDGRGAYTYKGCFGVETKGFVGLTVSSVNTLFYYGAGVSPPTSSVIPVITFSLTGNILTLLVNTSGGGSVRQAFITSLISYPTCSIIGGVSADASLDLIITAI